MADLVDIANERTEFHLELVLQRVTMRPVKPSAQFCEDCGDPIPLARQVAAPGCEACLDCQDLRERRR
ncbi:TraR/DksA C4-type zinc finger protein [Pseudomonas putida]|uniref:Transcriptional regulator n=2 Tax=Pseudomonas putida TaxID=303 RepID=A0A177SMG9_PSEPU|nr:TraR/DksA C4-type zinc finger protein [Pseudomonas putida]OAI91570.1 transcriptional regulator [Pseudomonas putida]